MNAPLVSVAIATWNGEQFLREQLDTIYAQTWKPIEVVVSDDASSDDTVGILEQYAHSHGLGYVVNPERLGLVKNFERAISMASGDFIALCDQDDLWKSHKIARLVDHIGDATLIYGKVAEYIDLNGHQRFDEKSETISHFARENGSGHPTRYLIAENWIVSHTVMFRRELIRHALPIPAHQRFHDGWLALVASKLGGVTYLDESLQIYRQHSESFTFAAPPANKAANRWLRLLSGDFKPNWRSRCTSETARLQDVLGLALLDPDDRVFTADLLDYYRSGLESGHGWSSFYSGARVSRSFVTQQGLIARLLMPLKGLIASSSD